MDDDFDDDDDFEQDSEFIDDLGFIEEDEEEIDTTDESESEEEESSSELILDDKKSDSLLSEEKDIVLYTNEKNINIKMNDIKRYKDNFLNKPNKMELLTNLISGIFLISGGGDLITLEKENNNELFENTEESKIIEGCLLGKLNTYTEKCNKVYNINDYNINDILLKMKLLLRPVLNIDIIVTENLKNKFPIFFKNIYYDYITEEELEENLENRKAMWL